MKNRTQKNGCVTPALSRHTRFLSMWIGTRSGCAKEESCMSINHISTSSYPPHPCVDRLLKALPLLLTCKGCTAESQAVSSTQATPNPTGSRFAIFWTSRRHVKPCSESTADPPDLQGLRRRGLSGVLHASHS